MSAKPSETGMQPSERNPHESGAPESRMSRLLSVAMRALVGMLVLGLAVQMLRLSRDDARAEEEFDALTPALVAVGDTLANVSVVSWQGNSAERSLSLREITWEQPTCMLLIVYAAGCRACQLVAEEWAARREPRPKVYGPVWLSVPSTRVSIDSFVARHSLMSEVFALRSDIDAMRLGVVRTPTAYLVDKRWTVRSVPAAWPGVVLNDPLTSSTGADECRL